MRAVAEDLPETPVQEGRLTKWSAEGMLARFYLTRAGVEASGGGKKQQFSRQCQILCTKSNYNSGRSLLPNYEDLFKYPYDNNAESLFELQWVFHQDQWGVQNSMPEYLAYSPDIAIGMDGVVIKVQPGG